MMLQYRMLDLEKCRLLQILLCSGQQKGAEEGAEKSDCVPNTAPDLAKSITLPVPLLKMERNTGTHATITRSSKSLHTSCANIMRQSYKA